VHRASSSLGPPKVYAFTQSSRRHDNKRSTPSAYNTQHTTRRTRGKRHAARAPHRADSAGRVAQHTKHNMSQRATPRIQRIAYTIWHACHMARTSCATCTTKHEDFQHATRRVNATGAHACTPSADTRPNALPARLKRTDASVLDIATASNSAVPFFIASTPPKPCARAHRAAARPPQKPGLCPISSSARATQTLHNGLDDRALRDGCTSPTQRATRTDATCNTHRCNVQHAPMQHANARRCNAPRAPMHRCADETCNTHRCIVPRASVQRATRTDAACNTHQCNTPTRVDATRQRAPTLHATRTDATRQRAPMQRANARRCIMQHATRIDAPCNAHRCIMQHAPMQHANVN
jgi:hypothetical protein